MRNSAYPKRRTSRIMPRSSSIFLARTAALTRVLLASRCALDVRVPYLSIIQFIESRFARSCLLGFGSATKFAQSRGSSADVIIGLCLKEPRYLRIRMICKLNFQRLQRSHSTKVLKEPRQTSQDTLTEKYKEISTCEKKNSCNCTDHESILQHVSFSTKYFR